MTAPRSRYWLLALLSLLLLPVGPQAASAAVVDDDIVWAVQPSSTDGPDGRSVFEYSFAPGQVLHDYVGLSNLGTTALELRLYATDAVVTTDGAAALLPADAPPADIGTWLTFPADTFTVQPGKRLDIPFTVKVPADATPGDHIGGIVASVAPTAAAGDGAGVEVDRRVGNRILARVAGPTRPALIVDTLKITSSPSVSPLPTAVVTYRVRNVGNVRLGAHARVQILGPLGIALRSAPDHEITELGPGSSMTVTQSLGAAAALGRLTAKVTLEPVSPPMLPAADAPSVTRTATIWAIPWLPLGALVVVAAIVAVRHRRPRVSAPASTTAAEGKLS